jgi:hypothetical protein
MISIASQASSTTAPAASSALSHGIARALLALVIAASFAAGLLATGTEASSSAIALAGADLTHLLRAMALLKSLIAAGMMWRLGSPVTRAWWAAYALACAGAAAGPGLIWQMAHVGAGALTLDVGLLAALILLWRDPVVGARLAMMVDARRAKLRSR